MRKMEHSQPFLERRRHQVFVTRNTEYHLRDGICVAVRDRQSGQWLDTHGALRQPMRGSVRLRADGAVLPSRHPPELGDALCFETTQRDLLTSALCAIERPPKPVVESYPGA